MTDKSNKSSSSPKRRTTRKKSSASKASPKTTTKSSSEQAPKQSTPAEEVETVEETTPEPAPKPQVGRSAQEWLSVAKVQLGVKPWIVRAAVAGHEPGRKYTETEIRELIRSTLSEPV